VISHSHWQLEQVSIGTGQIDERSRSFVYAVGLLAFEFYELNYCSIDTLLNVFLAIAVDNLANAQELTAAEEAAAAEQALKVSICFNSTH